MPQTQPSLPTNRPHLEKQSSAEVQKCKNVQKQHKADRVSGLYKDSKARNRRKLFHNIPKPYPHLFDNFTQDYMYTVIAQKLDISCFLPSVPFIVYFFS